MKIYLDFDGVLADTVECIVSLYNEDFKYFPNFKKIEPEDIDTWCFDELNCADYKYIDTYFNLPRFFDRLRLMSGADLLLDICKKYEIVIVSMGNTPNLIQKEIWLNKYFGNVISGMILVDFKDYKDKSHIDMSDGILIDDSANNLITSNAAKKICFGAKHQWNKEWTGQRVKDWSELYEVLNGNNT